MRNDWNSVSKNAKELSFEFTIILLLSDYSGMLLQDIINIDSYVISIYIAIILSIIISIAFRKKGK